MNRLIGITGNMASGKTTLCQKIIREKQDFVYVDVDSFRRDLLSDQGYVEELRKVIPALRQYEKVNSTILNEYIYRDEDVMARYKKVLYKYLFDYLDSFSDATIIVEWALIVNDDLLDRFDKVIYLDVSEEERISRLEDSNLSLKEIKDRFKLLDVNDLDSYESNKFLILKKDYEISEVIDYIMRMECKFTIPKDGGKVIWEVTHNCNYGCSYCMFSCQKTNSITGELTTEECYHVIDELVKNDFKHLKVTGGEPLLRKDIISILRYASRKMTVDISTNASLMTKEMVEALNQIDLKMIHVSLDGAREQHESVRGKGTYDATLRGLKLLEKSKNRIRIGSVIHKNNEYSLENLVQECLKVNASEVIFSIMEPVSGQDRSNYKRRPNEDLKKEIIALREKYRDAIIINYNFGDAPNYVTKCPAGDRLLFINNLGQVSPCEWVLENDKTCLSKSSLRDHTLKEVLSEEPLKRFTCHKKEGICYGILH